MKHVLILFVVLLLVPAAAFPGEGLKFGVGAHVTFPASDLEEVASTGYGGTGMLKFGLIPLIDLTGGVEYVKFTSKNDVSVDAWGYFVGGRVNIFTALWGGLELGGYSFSTEVSLPNLPSSEASSSEFFYAPMVGVNLGNIDVHGRYVVADGANFFTLRGMYWFGGGGGGE